MRLEGTLDRTSEKEISSLLPLLAPYPTLPVRGDAPDCSAGNTRNEDLGLRIAATVKLWLPQSQVMQPGNRAETELG